MFQRSFARRLATAVVGATLLAGSLAGIADAARGGNHGDNSRGGGKNGDSSLTLVNLTDDATSRHDSITFELSTTATDRPYVKLICSQAGRDVINGSIGYFEGWPWADYFVLNSSTWVDGGAECTAELYMLAANGRHHTLADVAFSVAP